MTTTSKPAPPKPAGPGPKPTAPTHPTPTAPPPRYVDDVFDLAASLGPDVAFTLPNTRVPLRFPSERPFPGAPAAGDGPPRPGHPGPPPKPRPGPPHPPPPGLSWLPAVMLPALLLVAAIDYTAWCAWWI